MRAAHVCGGASLQARMTSASWFAIQSAPLPGQSPSSPFARVWAVEGGLNGVDQQQVVIKTMTLCVRVCESKLSVCPIGTCRTVLAASGQREYSQRSFLATSALFATTSKTIQPEPPSLGLARNLAQVLSNLPWQ